jgi:hypothetical protein
MNTAVRVLEVSVVVWSSSFSLSLSQEAWYRKLKLELRNLS